MRIKFKNEAISGFSIEGQQIARDKEGAFDIPDALAAALHARHKGEYSKIAPMIAKADQADKKQAIAKTGDLKKSETAAVPSLAELQSVSRDDAVAFLKQRNVTIDEKATDDDLRELVHLAMDEELKAAQGSDAKPV